MTLVSFLLLTLFVAFLVYQDYQLGTKNGYDIAARSYVERVNVWHAELNSLREQTATLTADFQRLIADYNEYQQLKETEK